MTSDRPYRSALSKAAAVQEVDLNMGTQFDPALAEAFIGLVARGLRA
jgi:two-component system cell cycle response regulator